MRNARGFTLLEMLIGMTLLGFILALLYGGFRLASHSWNAFENRAERAADDQAGRALVRRLVSHAQPLHWKRLPGQPLAFTGQRESLRLVAPLTALVGLRLTELAIEQGSQAPDNAGGPLRVVLRDAPLRYDGDIFSDSFAEREAHPLFSGLADAGFAYFGPEKPGSPPQWWDAWPNPHRFPSLVRLRIVPASGVPFNLDMVPVASGDRFATVRAVGGPQ